MMRKFGFFGQTKQVNPRILIEKEKVVRNIILIVGGAKAQYSVCVNRNYILLGFVDAVGWGDHPVGCSSIVFVFEMYLSFCILYFHFAFCILYFVFCILYFCGLQLGRMISRLVALQLYLYLKCICIFVFCILYRFFLTGTPPKKSKYKKVNLGLTRYISDTNTIEEQPTG